MQRFSRQPPLLRRGYRRRRHRRGRRGADQRLLHPVAVVEPLQHADLVVGHHRRELRCRRRGRRGRYRNRAVRQFRRSQRQRLCPLRMAFALGRDRAVQHRDQQPLARRSLGRDLQPVDGEAYFLRAHYYYILVRLFGGVPLRLEPYNAGESTAIAGLRWPIATSRSSPTANRPFRSSRPRAATPPTTTTASRRMPPSRCWPTST